MARKPSSPPAATGPDTSRERHGTLRCEVCGRTYAGTMPAGQSRLHRKHVGTRAELCPGPYRLANEKEAGNGR
jgi:hypothetical protein